METYEAITMRRRISRDEDRPVPDDILRKLLVAAMSVPSFDS